MGSADNDGPVALDEQVLTMEFTSSEVPGRKVEINLATGVSLVWYFEDGYWVARDSFDRGSPMNPSTARGIASRLLTAQARLPQDDN